MALSRRLFKILMNLLPKFEAQGIYLKIVSCINFARSHILVQILTAVALGELYAKWDCFASLS